MFNYSEFIFEKSTLPSIGIPTEIMQIVQYDFEFSNNLNWFKSDKNDIIVFPNINRWDKSNLFAGVSEEKIFFIFSYMINDNVYYNYDLYNKIYDDFGEGWIRNNKIELNLKDIVNEILKFKGKIWYTPSENFKLTTKLKRKIHSIDKSLQDKTEKFKIKVIDKLDKLGIYIDENKKSNGLNKLEEFILDYEKKYSEIKNKYITIEYLLDEYDENKILRSFIYFIKTNKVLEL